MAVVPETEEATTPTFWPGVRFDAVKVGVKGSPASERNCGVMAKVVEVVVVMVKTETAVAATGLTDRAKALHQDHLKLPEETEVTGPLSRLMGGWPVGGGGASWMRVAR